MEKPRILFAKQLNLDQVNIILEENNRKIDQNLEYPKSDGYKLLENLNY